MAWRSGSSLSRALISTARVSSFRSTSLPRLRPPPLAAPTRLQSRRLSFSASRYLNGHWDRHRQVKQYVRKVRES